MTPSMLTPWPSHNPTLYEQRLVRAGACLWRECQGGLVWQGAL
jgi:hypothetical protein